MAAVAVAIRVGSGGSRDSRCEGVIHSAWLRAGACIEGPSLGPDGGRGLGARPGMARTGSSASRKAGGRSSSILVDGTHFTEF